MILKDAVWYHFKGAKYKPVNPPFDPDDPGPESGKEMKLGICVVYYTFKEDGQLLRLHLNQLKRFTTSPYTIYASANRLLSEHRKMLENSPEVKIIDIPTTDLRKTPEVGYYLEYLIAAAIKDNVTHVAIFHVDSFPITRGWEKIAVSLLTESCPLASEVMILKLSRKPGSKFMIFRADFYEKYQPRLLLDEDQLASPEYIAYRKKMPHVKDVGVGYGFKLFQERLSWIAFPVTNKLKDPDHPYLANIHGDLAFHVGAAARANKKLKSKKELNLHLSLIPWLRGKAPRLIKQIIKPLIHRLFWVSTDVEDVQYIKERLYEDPDRYISLLRTGDGLSQMNRKPEVEAGT
jgi:hypothetical protein